MLTMIKYLSEYVLDIFPDKISDLWCSIDNKDVLTTNSKSVDGENWYFLDEILDEARVTHSQGKKR